MKQEQHDTLIPFLVRAMIDGIVAGWTIMLSVLWFDIGNVGSMIRASDQHEMLVLLLAILFAITFGSAGMGIAVFTAPDDGDPPT